jgi:hypothetical protein
MADNNSRQVTGWVGWIYFAGFLMIVIGILQMIAGLTALLNDKYFLVRGDHLVVFDFTTWGWIHLVLGLVIMMAGSAVMSGRMWARAVGVIVAMFSIIVNFAFLSAYPVWSIVAIVIDVLVIYALTVHGAEAQE